MSERCHLCGDTGQKPGTYIQPYGKPFAGTVYSGVSRCPCRAVSAPSEEMQQIPAQYRRKPQRKSWHDRVED